MADDLYFKKLQLKEITELNRDELGRGAYGRVYAVKYCQTICAAKEIHSILAEGVDQVEMQRTVQAFMKECLQCSKLRHPNVIRILGVYYPTGSGGANLTRLPVMVMEMMADSLTSFVNKHKKIPVHTKYSIVHDVSLGLCYLHNQDPPIVYCDLSPNNVLLTVHHVAKISALRVAKVIKADSRKVITKAPGTVDFMSPETLTKNPVYGPPMDVFSFAGIILHTFNQQWPSPTDSIQFDPKTRRKIALLEVERRQQYLDKMIGEAKVLRPLVEECLDDDPAVRPTITTVCERIQVSKDAHMKESPQEYITLYQQMEQLNIENQQKDVIIEQQRARTQQNEVVMFSSASDPFSFADLALTASNKDSGLGGGSAGMLLFSTPSSNEIQTHDNFESTAEFKPIVKLSSDIKLQSGEENELVLFSHRAKLYRFDTSAKQWKERGIGDIKILKHKETGKFRVLMRRYQIQKLCCNHLIVKGMALTARNEKSFQWITLGDLSEEGIKYELFAVRFKLEKTASTFQKNFNDCLSNLDSVEKASLDTKQSKSASQATNLWERQSCCVHNDESVTKCIVYDDDHNPVTSINSSVTSSVASVNTSTVTTTKEEPIVTTTSTTKDQPSVTSCSLALSTVLTFPPVTTNSTIPATNPPVLVFGPPKISYSSSTSSSSFALKPATSEPNIFGSTNSGTFNFTLKATTSVPNNINITSVPFLQLAKKETDTSEVDSQAEE